MALNKGYGGESSRSTLKRIPLRFALLSMELFEPLPRSPRACVRTLWNVLVSGSCSAPKRPAWMDGCMHARTQTRRTLPPSTQWVFVTGAGGHWLEKRRGAKPWWVGAWNGERNTAFWRPVKGTGGSTCNGALVNNAPGLKRYRNVQTKLYLMLIFEVL